MNKKHGLPLETLCLALNSTNGEIGIESLYLFKHNTLHKLLTINGSKNEFLNRNYNDLFYLVRDLNRVKVNEYCHMFITLEEIKNEKQVLSIEGEEQAKNQSKSLKP